MILKINLVALFFQLISANSENATVHEQKPPTAFIYEKSNKDKIFLSYFHDTEFFEDIQAGLMHKKMKKAGQICVSGGA